MLLEIPPNIRMTEIEEFARRTGHALREINGRLTMVQMPPADNIVRPAVMPQLPTLTEVARNLNISYHQLIKRLHELGAITHDKRPTQRMVDEKLLHISNRARTNPISGRSTPYQVIVATAAGVEWIRGEIDVNG